VDPITYICGEPCVLKDLDGMIRVNHVKEASDVKEQECPSMSHQSYGLDAMDQGSNGVNCVVLGARAKL